MLNDAGTYNCTARSNGVVTTRSFQVVVEGKVWDPWHDFLRVRHLYVNIGLR